MRRSLCVVIHDVAPATLAPCRRLLAALEEVGDFPVTLLAVPRFHGSPRDPAFEKWLKERATRGDEVALHGYTHRDEGQPRNTADRLRRRFYTRGEGEFADLSFDEATRRLTDGVEWLRRLGLDPAGFVAPAWLLGAEGWRALRLQAFDYTCTLRHVHLLPAGGSLTCQSQVYSSSSAWRRSLSVAWCGALARLQRHDEVVRLELHPSDADPPRIRASWQRLARDQLATREAITLQRLALQMRLAFRTTPTPMSP